MSSCLPFGLGAFDQSPNCSHTSKPSLDLVSIYFKGKCIMYQWASKDKYLIIHAISGISPVSLPRFELLCIIITLFHRVCVTL